MNELDKLIKSMPKAYSYVRFPHPNRQKVIPCAVNLNDLKNMPTIMAWSWIHHWTYSIKD